MWGNSGGAAEEASMSAWRLVPEPDMRTVIGRRVFFGVLSALRADMIEQ